MEANEKDVNYFKGFDVGVMFVLTSIILHFENGEDLMEMIKSVIDPELDKMKAH